jgi:hypothetical protein
MRIAPPTAGMIDLVNMLFLLPPRFCEASSRGTKKPSGVGGLNVVPYAGITRIRFEGFSLRSRVTFRANTPLFIFAIEIYGIMFSGASGFLKIVVVFKNVLPAAPGR